MQNNLKYFPKIPPFLVIILSVIVAVVAIIIFSWLLIWGIVLGFIAYLILRIKMKFFPKKIKTMVIEKEKERIGNVYEHDEINKS